MVTQSTIDSFLGESKLALAGVSSTANKFGNVVLKELSAQGYDVLLVHPSAKEINGVSCYKSLSELPDSVGGLVMVVPPAQTERLVQEAHRAGIKKVWMQQGAESADAVEYCVKQAMEVIHGECILMYAEPQGFHKLHHWFRGLVGKLPARHVPN